MAGDDQVERWELTHRTCRHVLELRDLGVRREISWLLDDVPLARTSTIGDRVALKAGKGVQWEGDLPPHALLITLPTFIGPARRVTLFSGSTAERAKVKADLGSGGVDFVPDPDSKAARRGAWIEAHPTLFTVQHTVLAILKVVLPILFGYLVLRFVFSLPWPDIRLPRIPWPDIPWPEIPWPEIRWPEIPWPDIAWPHVSFEIPQWLRRMLELAKYVAPVLAAFVFARAELRRRRQQSQHRMQHRMAASVKHGAEPEVTESRGSEPEAADLEAPGRAEPQSAVESGPSRRRARADRLDP